MTTTTKVLPSTVRFKKWDCVVRFSTYSNNQRVAILLHDFEDGMPVATATVNITEAVLAPDEVIIKDYGENEGMLQCLQQAGIVGEVLYHIRTGYVSVPVCKLLV